VKTFTKMLAIALTAAVLLTGCGGGAAGGGSTPASADGGSGGGSAPADQVVIKAGHVVSTSDNYHLALVKMGELIGERTDGRYKIEVYPNAQIGSERDLIEGVQLGSVGMCVVATAPVANFAPKLNVVELPFLIKDFEHADRMFMGEIGRELADTVTASAGIKCLGLWENGFRSVVNSKRPINSVEDVKGLKIRTMENSAHQALWSALGADPVPMAWGDAYTAVQQGALDGLENAITLLYSLKTAEITKYLAVTEHLYSPAVVLLGDSIWSNMSDEDKKIFEDTFAEVSVYEREVSRKAAATAEQGLKDQGLEVTHPDKEAFRQATEKVKEELSRDYADIVARIEAA